MKKAYEIQLKKVKNEGFELVKITDSKDSAKYARQFYFDDLTIFESFFLICLNRQNETISYVKISQGGTVGTVCEPKLIAKYAIDSLANSVVLVHNHPSGSLKPSQQDKTITNKIINGLDMFDIKVLDHIILTENSYYSFADNYDL